MWSDQSVSRPARVDGFLSLEIRMGCGGRSERGNQNDDNLKNGKTQFFFFIEILGRENGRKVGLVASNFISYKYIINFFITLFKENYTFIYLIWAFKN